MNVDKMIGTWSDYDPWQRLWPGIDEKMGNRCRELQSSNYGEFVKKENKGMETKYSYSPCKERYRIPSIVKVIYNPPATIILWEDETKTVVKCCETDIYDSEKGFAMAVIKKLCGNESALFHKLFKTWVLESKDAPKESIPPFNIIIDGIDPAKQLKDMINRIFSVGGSDGN